jgi:hypothetical protein
MAGVGQRYRVAFAFYARIHAVAFVYEYKASGVAREFGGATGPRHTELNARYFFLRILFF